MSKSQRSVKGDPLDRDDAAEAGPESGAHQASFETALAQLEGTVARLEEGEMPLEEALALFESGVKLSRQCATTLEEAERRVEILVADRGLGEDPEVVPFESDEAADEGPETRDDEDFED